MLTGRFHGWRFCSFELCAVSVCSDGSIEVLLASIDVDEGDVKCMWKAFFRRLSRCAILGTHAAELFRQTLLIV